MDAQNDQHKREGMEGRTMEERQNLIGYALQVVPRPGARETRVKKAPDGMRIRNERGNGDAR